MARKRTPGRPQRDSIDLRDSLISAALACYVREGVAATSVKTIATEAGVTPALLHYYFGNREQLQQAVVEDRILPLLRGVQGKLMAADDTGSLIATFIAAIGEAVAENPWWPTLWVREVLCEGGALRAVLIERAGGPFMETVTQRFAAAQERGELNKDLDPRLLIVSLMGLTLFPAASAPVWRQLLAADDVSGSDLQQHTLALLQRGLELKR